MEQYYLPPVLRKVLKTSKMEEMFEVRSSRRDKIIPHFDDPNGIFSKQVLESFEKEVTFKIYLIAFQQKDYLFKLPIVEKVQRLSFMKTIATDFFKAGNLRKADKLYTKVHSYFRTKDAKKNFQEEDETQEEYQNQIKELDTLNKTCLSNLCVIQAKKKAWKEVIKHAEEALLVDPDYVKARYHKGRALIELSEYPKAIEDL